MSALRTPAARADRREGGRRGRIPSRHRLRLHGQLIRAAVLPTLAAGLSGAAAVIFSLQLRGVRADARLGPVLAGCALLFGAALWAAVLGAQRGARNVQERCEALRRSSARGRQEFRAAAEQVERGEPLPARRAVLPGRGGDEFDLLSQELRLAREQAHAVLGRSAAPGGRSDSEQKVEVFVNLARRLQSLVHREIRLLDGLEDTVEDPDLLRELFHVDHLATRIRRHAENLAVLGGAASRRQWTRPIDISEVLRSSVAEVEQYTRVKVVPPAGGSVRGHAVADVVHLLAELVENATVFSAPDTDVLLRAERVTAGIAIEVEDRGLGMPAEEQHRMNALLGDPDQVSVRRLLHDGRIGLYVVSALARRHGIAVELKSNIYGGVLAVLVLPRELLGAATDAAAGAGTEGLVPAAPHLADADGGGAFLRTGQVAGEAAAPVPAGVGAPLGVPVGVTMGLRASVGAGPVPAASPIPQVPQVAQVPLVTQVPQTQQTPQAPHTPQASPLPPIPSVTSAAALAPVRMAPADPRTVPGWAAVPRPAGLPAPGEEPPRPPLPRRTARQYAVPEPRETAPARPAGAEAPVHDPGLMAAFQRGFGLAQAAESEHQS